MNNVKILDCTLRDGGYVNNWEFGEAGIQCIMNGLTEAGVDLIEAGFLSRKEPFVAGRTIYTDFDVANTLPALNAAEHVACMINYGAYPIDEIPPYAGGRVNTLRVAFHRKDLTAALDFCEQIKGKGYDTFVQPMATTGYSEQEIAYLMERCNQIRPKAVYIVDSFGTMQRTDVLRLLACYDKELDSSISIGFHSHNNLQLSFPNAQEILRQELRHAIIIDSSVFGMGRGAGNLCTELITMYLNENYNAKYRIVPVLEIIDNCLNAIFIKTPWGYSVPFYVAAINQCHPNYATYLLNKQTLGVKQINIILSQIPEENKRVYNAKLAEQLYLNHQACAIDDGDALRMLQQQLAGRKVLLLAPGKSLTTHQAEIEQFIEANNAFIISINFIPEQLKVDTLFLSNTKRFATMSELEGRQVVATSNIAALPDFLQVDYTSLINPESSESDNAGLMLLRLLQKIGISHVNMAGYDGFSADIHENYYNDQLINNTVTEIFQNRNASVAEQLKELMQKMDIHFITPSRYVR